MPFGLLWCCYLRQGDDDRGADEYVTNAFRPFVVLLHLRGRRTQGSVRRVTNAFRPFVVLLQATAKGVDFGSASHQCLSAFCGVVTLVHPREVFRAAIVSPMPFGLLWCCYKSAEGEATKNGVESPMPFGLLWCFYLLRMKPTTLQA